MEIWFWAALGATLLAGISNFVFKLVAKNGFDSENFNFYGGVWSVIIMVPVTLVLDPFR